jgi:nitrite reductase/ring-hydroxylating ferredoxin subunit/uncharacterized membrane protein
MTLQAVEKQIQDAVDDQAWLDNVSEPIQGGTQRALGWMGKFGDWLQNTLNGIWLGHPLHPVLTDIPIGAFSATVALDIMEITSGEKALGKGADASLAIGLAGAAGAAITGLSDWQYTEGEARRFGMLHAILNVTSLAFYIPSLILRRRKQRTLGRYLSFAGYSLSVIAAYLGGDLVFRQKIGVNHAPQKPISKDWKYVMQEGDLLDGQMKMAEVDGVKVLIARRNGNVYAIAETCAHQGGPLSKGQYLEDNTVICPWHGSRFSLESGKVLHGPSAFPQPCYQTRVNDGHIQIRQSPQANA